VRIRTAQWIGIGTEYRLSILDQLEIDAVRRKSITHGRLPLRIVPTGNVATDLVDRVGPV